MAGSGITLKNRRYLSGILEQLIPSDETAWFIPEGNFSSKKNGLHWEYEGKLKTVASVLGEMYCFEYYIVSEKLEWLLGETHHDILIGTGNLYSQANRKL